MLIVHPASQIALDRLARSLPHAVILSGTNGVGLSTIAQSLAKRLTKTPMTVLPEKDEKIDLEKGTITVDIIRKLYSQTKSKQTTKRIIVVDYADRMTRQAQNAFLKLLEEPNESTHFILVVHNVDQLLATVRSRAQHTYITPITTEQSKKLLDGLSVHDSTKRTQLLFMADGLPAELTRLVSDDTYFAARAAIVRDARTLIKGTPYERLMVAHTYRDDRVTSLLLLSDAMKIARHSLRHTSQPELLRYTERLHDTYERIARNGNVRLSLATLMV